MTRFVALALLAAACARPPVAPSSTALQAPGPDVALDPALTVATVNGVAITAAELDAKITDDLAGAVDEYVTKVHGLRRDTLEQLVAERLIKAESAARGVGEEALMKAEIADKVTAPDDEELQALYERVVKPSRPDVPFEAAKPYLTRQAMEQAQQRRAMAFLDELKGRYKASVNLPGPKVARIDVAASGPSHGPADAKVTIVEFSDFQCPYCSRAAESVRQVEKTYGDKVRVVFRHFPLSFHDQARKAAEAGFCAAEQGKFWEMHDRLFAHQEALAPEALKEHARELGLDGAKFDDCLDSGKGAAKVDEDMAAGKKARVNGTPAFFINGRSLSGAQPFEAFKTVIDEELAAK